MKRPVIVFSDFDGTISVRDVGYHLFHHFSGGRNERFVPDWKSGKMTSREVLTAEAGLCSLSESSFNDYLKQHKLDDSLRPFLDKVTASGGDVTVLSDGLMPYIDRLLTTHGLSLPVIANSASIADNRLTVEFQHENTFCAYCGCCKRERIAERLPKIHERHPNALILFIGDGMSDRCVVEPNWPHRPKKTLLNSLPKTASIENIQSMHSHDEMTDRYQEMAIIPPVVVYAKKDLAKFCDINQVVYRPFQTFSDITEDLSKRGIW